MAFCGISLSRSLLGVKRACRFAPHMSAFDPKRIGKVFPSAGLSRYDALFPSIGEGDETARVHYTSQWCGSYLAIYCTRAAASDARDRISRVGIRRHVWLFA